MSERSYIGPSARRARLRMTTALGRLTREQQVPLLRLSFALRSSILGRDDKVFREANDDECGCREG
jgi:hypothetical protein